MIVDFVSIKQRLDQTINIFIREEIKKRTPFLSEVGRQLLHEGDKHSYETVDHEKGTMEFQEAGSSFQLTQDQMGKITFGEIFERMAALADDMAKQMEGNVFRKLSKEMEERNRTVPGSVPFSRDTLLKALEMMQIDFEDGLREKPQLPSLVIHPEALAKAQEQEAGMTEEEKKAFDEKEEHILDRKFQEYMEREGKRKIVD